MPGIFDEKPTGEFIQQTAAHLTTVWDQTVEKMRMADSYILGTFKVFEDERDKRHAYHPPKAAAKVQHAVDTQLGLLPSVHKQGRGNGAAGEARANNVEKGLKAVMREAFWATPNPAAKTLYRNLVSYGIGNIYTDWNERYGDVKLVRRRAEIDEDYEKRQAAKKKGPLANPVCVYSIHPSRMLASPGESTPAVAIVKSRKPSYEIAALLAGKREYIKAKDVADYEVESDPFKLVDVVEYKTAGYLAMCRKDGEILYCEENSFGFQPVHIAYSGWGGESSGGGDPSEWCVGLLEPVYESLRTLAMKRSAVRTAALRLSQLRLISTRPPEELAAALDNPNAVINARPDELAWLEHPQIAAWIVDSTPEEREIDEATYEASVYGTPSGVDTVGQEIILKTAAAQKFMVLNDQMERMSSMVARDICEMVDIRQTTIEVGEDKLAPDDMDGSYEVYCKYVVIDPLIEMRSQEVDMKKVELGLMSPEDFWENHHVENGTETQRRLDKSMLRKFITSLPPEQNPILQAVLEQAGMSGMLQEIQQKMLAASQSPQPQGEAQ